MRSFFSFDNGLISAANQYWTTAGYFCKRFCDKQFEICDEA